jgi:hypothetical protein
MPHLNFKMHPAGNAINTYITAIEKKEIFLKKKKKKKKRSNKRSKSQRQLKKEKEKEKKSISHNKTI